MSHPKYIFFFVLPFFPHQRKKVEPLLNRYGHQGRTRTHTHEDIFIVSPHFKTGGGTDCQNHFGLKRELSSSHSSSLASGDREKRILGKIWKARKEDICGCAKLMKGILCFIVLFEFNSGKRKRERRGKLVITVSQIYLMKRARPFVRYRAVFFVCAEKIIIFFFSLDLTPFSLAHDCTMLVKYVARPCACVRPLYFQLWSPLCMKYRPDQNQYFVLFASMCSLFARLQAMMHFCCT